MFISIDLNGPPTKKTMFPSHFWCESAPHIHQVNHSRVSRQGVGIMPCGKGHFLSSIFCTPLPLTQINECYSFGFSSKLNSLEAGKIFQLPKSCPFSIRICRSNPLRSSTAAGHTPHFFTYGSTTFRTS